MIISSRIYLHNVTIRPMRLYINELRRDNKTNRIVTTVTQSAKCDSGDGGDIVMSQPNKVKINPLRHVVTL